MFDIGWSEIAIVAAIALIIVGPKDLPKALHTMGKWIGKAKTIARDFQNSLDEVVRDAELEDVKKQIQSVTSTDVKGLIEKSVDDDGTLRDAFTFDGVGADKPDADEAEANDSDSDEPVKAIEAEAQTEEPVAEAEEPVVEANTPVTVTDSPEVKADS